MKNAFKTIKTFLKSVGEFLCADLIAYLFTQLLNTAVFPSTRLYQFRYEYLRMEICNAVALGLFLLVMVVKPLLYHINREASTRAELKKLYISETRMTCIAYLVYTVLVLFTPLKGLIFFGVSFLTYYDLLGTSAWQAPLVAIAVFFVIMIVENVVLYHLAARKLPKEQA